MFKYYEITKLVDAPFKYALVTGPIDWWMFTLTKEQLVSNMRDMYNDTYELNAINIEEIESFIIDSVTYFEERPHTIRYTSIPTPNSCDCSLVAVAKISNNGTCFVFSDHKEYLELIEKL